jgi:hypothetical protein
MANTPKPVRKDAKRSAEVRRNPTTGNPNRAIWRSKDSGGFGNGVLKNIGYISSYGVRNSGLPKRTREFELGKIQRSIQGTREVQAEMDKDYKEAKAWKAANPDYVYPGGTGDR